MTLHTITYCSLGILFVIATDTACGEVREYKFLQKVDHFSAQTSTFYMRYFSSFDNFFLSGPAIIFVGDESAADPERLESGFVVDLARDTGGVLFLLEHRYYGESIIVPKNSSNGLNQSEIIEKLKQNKYAYLSIEQVLADIAFFVEYIRKSDKISKVVLVGGSYSGRLAAWARLDYPHLIDAAIASSAPMKNVMEFPEYHDSVARIYNDFGGHRCLKAIQEKIKFENFLFRYDDADQQYLKKSERFCTSVNISTTKQQQIYGAHVLNRIALAAVSLDIEQIKEHCSEITSVHPKTYEAGCFMYNFTIAGWKESPYDYMRCTQLGQFQTASVYSSLFPYDVPIDMYMARCTLLYGKHINKENLRAALKRLDEEYGGMRPNVTRVVFVNGGLDPWRHLGILEDLSPEAPAVFIPRGSHTKDLSSFRENNDSNVDVQEAQMRVKDIIKKWIGIENITKDVWSFFKPVF